jgi:hypothetical protein
MDGTFRKSGIYRHRWQWWFPWSVTDWPDRRTFPGADEYCNESIGVVLPPFGCLVVFYQPGRLRRVPCEECWEQLQDWQQADYAPCGWLHGGRLREHAHHHVIVGPCAEAQEWLCGGFTRSEQR